MVYKKKFHKKVSFKKKGSFKKKAKGKRLRTYKMSRGGIRM